MKHPRIPLFFVLLSSLFLGYTAGSQSIDPKAEHKLIHLEVVPTFSILYSHGFKLDEEEPFSLSAENRKLKPVFSYSIGINSTLIELKHIRFGFGLAYLKSKLNFVNEQNPESSEIRSTQSRFKIPIFTEFELGNFGGFIKMGIAFNHLINVTSKGKPSKITASNPNQIILEEESPSINKDILSAEISLGIKRSLGKRSLYFDLGYSYDLANNSDYKSTFSSSKIWSPSGYYPSFKTGIINLGLGFGF